MFITNENTNSEIIEGAKVEYQRIKCTEYFQQLLYLLPPLRHQLTTFCENCPARQIPYPVHYLQHYSQQTLPRLVSIKRSSPEPNCTNPPAILSLQMASTLLLLHNFYMNKIGKKQIQFFITEQSTNQSATSEQSHFR